MRLFSGGVGIIYKKHRWHRHHIKILTSLGKKRDILASYRALAKGFVGESVAKRYLMVLYSRGKIKAYIEKPALIKEEGGKIHKRLPDAVIFYGKWYCPLIVEIKFGRIRENMVKQTVRKYSDGYLKLSKEEWETLKYRTWRTKRVIRRKICPIGIIMISVRGAHEAGFIWDIYKKYGVIIIDERYLYHTIDGIRNREKYIRAAIIQSIDKIANRIEKKLAKRVITTQ